MSTAEPGRVVFLIPSSSPPRPQFRTFTMSSSPPQPSTEDSIRRKLTLRGGSHADQIAPYATASFTTASTLLKSNNTLGIDFLNASATGESNQDEKDNLPVKMSPKLTAKTVEDVVQDLFGPTGGDANEELTTKRKPTKKPRAKKVEAGASKESASKKKLARKPRGIESAVAEDDGPKTKGPKTKPKTKPERKPRAKKVSKDAQSKLPVAQVAKPGIEKKCKKVAAVSKHFPTNECLDELEQDFGLEEAVPRRAVWTPPPTLPELTVETPLALNMIDLSGFSAGSPLNDAIKVFPDLYRSFGYKIDNPPIIEKKVPIELGSRKRKLIELVKTNVPIKAVKKKARTLTDLATSIYADEPPPEPAPLLHYFSRETAEKVPRDNFKVPTKPRAVTKKPKKGTAKAPILLSPESAIKEVTKQDFVFGTSSQLAREQSPTLLRDLHAAMQASNELDDGPITNWLLESADSSVPASVNLTTKRNLWSAASRGEVDQMQVQSQTDEMGVDVTTPEPVEILQSPAKKPPRIVKKADTEMPKFEAYTTAQLTKQVASYRFKPVKKREQMILLLEKCWESKHRIALNALGTNDMIGSSHKESVTTTKERSSSCQDATSSPKKPRGRPRQTSNSDSIAKNKRSTNKYAQESNAIENPDFDSDAPLSQIRTPKKLQSKTMQHVEDISDSELEPTAARHFNLHVQSPTAPLSLQISLTASSEDSPLLFDSITRAVMSEQVTKAPKNPNWHEKILLYDPIVLEDLTVWLNTSGLEKAGWDGEIEPKEVKKWCESKSICCLWRESLRNGTRNRY